jgi:NAD(P)H-dependent FMN reductase
LSDSTRVLLISGSTRHGSANTAALTTAAALAPAAVTPVLYGGLAGLTAFNPDHDGDLLPPAAAELRGEIAAAAAVLFCCRFRGGRFVTGMRTGTKRSRYLDGRRPSV